MSLVENVTITFQHDDCESNPLKEWDWPGLEFFYGHRRYDLGGTQLHSSDEMDETMEEAEDAGKVVVRVYMYDHSGITVSTAPFSCPWDSGLVGFVICDPKEFGSEEDAISAAKAMVKTLDYYLTGNVWFFNIESESGEHDESCGGFYGDELDELGVLDYIPEELHDIAREAWENRFN